VFVAPWPRKLTNAQQTNKNLLLSNDAQWIPSQLEISAD